MLDILLHIPSDVNVVNTNEFCFKKSLLYDFISDVFSPNIYCFNKLAKVFTDVLQTDVILSQNVLIVLTVLISLACLMKTTGEDPSLIGDYYTTLPLLIPSVKSFLVSLLDGIESLIMSSSSEISSDETFSLFSICYCCICLGNVCSFLNDNVEAVLLILLLLLLLFFIFFCLF
jgi:hypothetical protein